MPVSSRYVLQQGPMLATLGKTAAWAVAQRIRPKRNGSSVHAPSPEIVRSIAPPAPELLDAFVRHLGGDPRAYRGIVPPHFFPHWALPLAGATLAGISYPLLRILNAGCRMQVNAPLPRGERLEVRAQLTNIDDDGKRALLIQRVITGTSSRPDALIAEIHALVPLAREKSDGGPRKERPRVPSGAREVAFVHLSGDAGLSFAKLTGDFNPIHWIRPYAKAAGFRSVILHGFGTFARSVEALNRGVFGGDVHRLRVLEARFTRPLVLPHDVGFYVREPPRSAGDRLSSEGSRPSGASLPEPPRSAGDRLSSEGSRPSGASFPERELFVGDAPLGPAYLTGHFETAGDA